MVMATAHLADLLRHLRRVAGAAQATDLTDGQLLERFRSQGEEAAFAVLVQRHGLMVLTVCRRLLSNAQDAEDAFQAAFFVLARKAASIHERDSVASWLYGVACRVARKLRTQELRRRARERKVIPMMRPEKPGPIALPELRTLLDEELSGLPDKYRAPLVLCYLEGKTHAEAARELGCPRTSLSSRLARGRQLLQHRLARRGITVTAGLLAAALPAGSGATVPALLTIAAVRAAVLAVSKKAGAAGLVSGKAINLAEGVLRTMTATTVQGIRALLLTVSLACAAAGVLHQGATADVPAPPAAADKDAATAPDARQTRSDRYGDLLPDFARMRLGTVRFRHGSTVTGVAFAPDGKTLFSCSYDKTLRLWDLATGRELRRFPPLHGSAYGLSVAADGKLVAVNDGGTAYLADLATGQLTQPKLQPLEIHTCVALSPDGRTLAAGCVNMVAATNPVRLWDVATGKPLHECAGHAGDVKHIVFAPDGKMLATGGGDQTVRLWDVSTGKEALRLEGKGGVLALAFSGDGQIVASGGQDGKLRLWEVASGKLLHELGAHYSDVSSIAFCPDRKIVASAGGGDAIYFWDVTTGKELRKVLGNASGIAFSPDGTTLAWGGHECTIRIWDVSTGKERTLPEIGHRSGVRAVAITGDGRTAATIGGDRFIHLWEVATGKELRQLDAFTPYLVKMAMSPDGKVVASNAGLWEVATGKLLGRLKDQDYGIEAIAFSPDSRTVAFGSADGGAAKVPRVRLWDVATLKEVGHFGEQLVHSLSYSADGKVLAAGNSDGTIGLWEAASGRERQRLRGHQRKVDSVVFSPDGKVLASSSFDGAILLWDAATGKQLRQFPGDSPRQRPVLALAFSPDGRMLASAEQPFTSPSGMSITLWEVATGRMRRELAGHQGDVNCLAFARDGKTLLSGSTDTTALVWDVTAEESSPAPSRELAPEQQYAVWDDLLRADAAPAYRAICALARSPHGVKFLKGRLPPARAAKADEVAELIKALDSDVFSEREKARQELEKLGETAEAALRKALADQPSAETRRQVDQLLDRLQGGEWLRTQRALEALELLRTPEARQLLQELSEGAADARLTQEAKAALRRLADRPTNEP
jgi:RNA polymerase sigma factor (sigma-70 family)